MCLTLASTVIGKCVLHLQVFKFIIYLPLTNQLFLCSLISRKLDEDALCQSGMTTWGCFHSGSAEVSRSASGTGDYSNSESAVIINGKDGTFYFEVQHVLDDLAANEQDRLMPSILSILVNGDGKAAYQHNANDEKNLKAIVTCDSFCNCIIEKEESCSLHAELKYPDDPEAFGYHRDE